MTRVNKVKKEVFAYMTEVEGKIVGAIRRVKVGGNQWEARLLGDDYVAVGTKEEALDYVVNRSSRDE